MMLLYEERYHGMSSTGISCWNTVLYVDAVNLFPMELYVSHYCFLVSTIFAHAHELIEP